MLWRWNAFRVMFGCRGIRRGSVIRVAHGKHCIRWHEKADQQRTFESSLSSPHSGKHKIASLQLCESVTVAGSRKAAWMPGLWQRLLMTSAGGIDGVSQTDP